MIWGLLFGVLLSAWGWARYIAANSAMHQPLLLTACLVPALAFGGLSLGMLWLGLLGAPITFVNSTGVYIALMLPGWWLSRGDWRVPRPAWPTTWPARVAWACLGIIGAAVLLNAVLWGFYRPDTLGIYVPFAQEIAATNALAPINEQRTLYELYPQLMSMNYAYVYLAAGWENPYPARAINALLSLSVLPATALLARLLDGRRAAVWGAVLLVGLTPDVGNWASSGYVDLPMAFYYVLAATFAWTAAQHGRLIDAALAGVMVGLAAWTKNAALLSVLLVLTFMLWGLIRGKITLKQGLLSSFAIVFTAAPWYIRNMWLSGRITPDTVWTENANQTLRELFVLITLPQNYGLPGVVMTVGVGWGLWQLVRGRQRQPAAFLFWWSAPFFAFWFWLASYDPRFILLFLPFLAVLGGMVCASAWQRVGQRRRKPIQAVIMLLTAVLAVQVAWHSVDYKRAWLQDPLMTHAEKQQVIRER